jgi:endonuclease/exonuclease/phosphatase family metal-dependent hydrolase
VGRDDGKTKGEFSAILYKHNKFEILSDSTFWLSKTPNAPGSKDWDAMITRLVTTTRLKDKKTKTVYTMINTHFDHVGAEARKQSAMMLKDYVKSSGADMPVIITGDFNCTPTDEPYLVMVEKSQPQLIDSAPENTPGTFCNFEVNSMPCRTIDYIFHTTHWMSSSHQVITDNDGRYYPSDHLPVLVELSLKK